MINHPIKKENIVRDLLEAPKQERNNLKFNEEIIDKKKDLLKDFYYQSENLESKDKGPFYSNPNIKIQSEEDRISAFKELDLILGYLKEKKIFLQKLEKDYRSKYNSKSTLNQIIIEINKIDKHIDCFGKHKEVVSKFADFDKIGINEAIVSVYDEVEDFIKILKSLNPIANELLTTPITYNETLAPEYFNKKVDLQNLVSKIIVPESNGKEFKRKYDIVNDMYIYPNSDKTKVLKDIKNTIKEITLRQDNLWDLAARINEMNIDINIQEKERLLNTIKDLDNKIIEDKKEFQSLYDIIKNYNITNVRFNLKYVKEKSEAIKIEFNKLYTNINF